MARLGTISVGMELDATHFGSGLSKVSTEVRTFSGDVDRLGGAMKAAFAIGGLAYGGAKVGGFLMDVSRMAANAEDSVNALTITFGDQAGKVEGFARDMASAYHLGLNRVLDTQNQFGSIFQGAGFDEKQIAQMTEGMTRIALDQTRLRSGFTFEEMKRKFLSGLTGEQEPLKAVGLTFNEATIKDQAKKMGMGDGKGDLTEQQKVLARYAYFVERSKVAMGTAAREADNLAARISGITGAWEDMQLMVGQMVAPTIAGFMDDLTTGLQVGAAMWNENSSASTSWFTSLTADLGVATSGMGLFAESIGTVGDVIQTLGKDFQNWSYMTSWGVGQMLEGLGGMIGGKPKDGAVVNDGGLMDMLGALGVGDKLMEAGQFLGIGAEELLKEIDKPDGPKFSEKWAAEFKRIREEGEKTRQALADKPIEVPDPILGGADDKAKKKAKGRAAEPYAGAMLEGSVEAVSTYLRSTYGAATSKDAEKTAANTRQTVDVLRRADDKLGQILGKFGEAIAGGNLDWM